MENDVLVSVLCTAYNHQDYIEDALKGFINQKTNFRYEVLVHDDASTDNTANIIIEYANKYPEIIKPILQKENQYSKGVKICPKILYTVAKGKYLALCEGDDYWIDDNKLQAQVEFMIEHPECSLCFHAAKIYNVKDNKFDGMIKPYNKTCILPSDELFYGGGDDVPTASILYKKEKALDFPQFALDSPVGDHPLALLLSYRGRIAYIDKVMSVRNLWVPNSWNTEFNLNGNIEKKIRHIRAMIELLDKYDTYTEHKFGSQIKKRILAGEMEIQKVQGKYPFADKKVIDLLKSFNWISRIKIRVNYKMPSIFMYYWKIKKITSSLLMKRI